MAKIVSAKKVDHLMDVAQRDAGLSKVADLLENDPEFAERILGDRSIQKALAPFNALATTEASDGEPLLGKVLGATSPDMAKVRKDLANRAQTVADTLHVIAEQHLLEKRMDRVEANLGVAMVKSVEAEQRKAAKPDVAERYRQKALETTDPTLRRGYLEMAAEHEGRSDG